MRPGNNVGVLALPAKTGALRQRLFHNRRGVDKYLDLAVKAGGDELCEVLQLPLDHVMVVAISGIHRNGAMAALGQNFQRIVRGGVYKNRQRSHFGQLSTAFADHSARLPWTQASSFHRGNLPVGMLRGVPSSEVQVWPG